MSTACLTQALKTSSALGASWTLRPARALAPKPEVESELLGHDSHTKEAVFGTDSGDEKVQPSEVAKEEKYRCTLSRI